VPAALVAVLVALLPDLAWGVAGRLEPVAYPRDWERARDVVAARGGGDVVLLPWGAFRAFEWNGGRTVLDPAARYLPGSVVADDALVVGRTRIDGEGHRSAAAAAALRSGDPATGLRGLGVRWVVVHRGQPGARPIPALRAGRTVLTGPNLRLVRLTGQVADRRLPAATAVVVVADVLALLLLLGAGLVLGKPALANRVPTGLLVGRVHRPGSARPPNGT
jgi:hypothetical protein